MTTYTEDFEGGTNPGWTVAPWIVYATTATVNGGAAFAFPEADLPPEIQPAPSANTFGLIANDAGSNSTLTISGDFASLGAIDFDFAVFGTGDADYQFILDGFVVDGNPTPHAWQHLHLTTGAGTHTLVIKFDANSANWDPSVGAGLVLDNMVVTNANSLVGATGGGTATPFKRGEIVRHLGGTYICRTDGATTEPGPGDSADWYEMTPRTLPVRASATNPFATGEAGLWLVLDGTGAMTGQQYVSGA